jgi:NitT/TauT family transport system permease protein
VRTLRAAAVFVLAVGAWEAAVRSGWVASYKLPAPSTVAAWLARATVDGTLVSATGVTLRRLLTGYAVGLVAGVPLGLLNARSRTAADTLGVLALGLQTLPSVCWAPLAVLALGASEDTMLFIVVMGTLWSILLATDHGIRSVPPIFPRAARVMGARGLSLVVRVLLPAALPFVVSGMKQGWAFAWRSLMAAEVYVSLVDAQGLGLVLHYGREMHRMEQVLGTIVVILVVGVLVDRLLFSAVERSLHRRWGTGR